MYYRDLSRILGTYLLIFSLFLLIPLGYAFYGEFIAPEHHLQPFATTGFAFTLLITLLLGFGCRFLGRKATGTLYRREGLILVVLIWFVTALIGGLPFWLSGTLDDPLDAYFESMSGITTTGATIMRSKEYNPLTGEEIPIQVTLPLNPKVTYDFYGTITPIRNPETGEILLSGVEAVAPSLLFWRSFMQWIGGMGIVVLFLAILPALGVGGKVLYQAEAPGPIKEGFTPRIRGTASLLWRFYIFMSIAEVLLLLLTNEKLSLFDAICVTFSNVSTGGFAVRNESIGSYHNLATEIVVICFMVFGSINFIHYLHIIKRKLSRLADPELWSYLLSLIFSCGVVIATLLGTQFLWLATTGLGEELEASWGDAFRYGIFQVVSCQTSTGFSTANYDQWPYLCQFVLLTIMFIGGMSSSTAGGMKVIRHITLWKIVGQRVEAIFRPRAVHALRIGKADISPEAGQMVLSFFYLIILLTIIGSFLLIADGVDPETALSTNACMLNNIGIGFRMGGPTQSFAFLSSLGKLVSILWMVLGRLELFAILILFIPDFWRAR